MQTDPMSGIGLEKNASDKVMDKYSPVFTS